LKITYNEPNSNFAFKLNVRRYIKDFDKYNVSH